MSNKEQLPLIIIGAGPVGLAAAAHLLQRGIEPLVLEAGTQVGNAIRHWSHVRMFSPWSFNIDRASRQLLERQGWKAPCGTGYPTGADIVTKYLEPLAQVPELQERIRYGQRVTAIARAGTGKVRNDGRETRPFEVHAVDKTGNEIVYLAFGIVDASGTWEQPNPAGASGLYVPGEKAAQDRIAYGMPDVLGKERARYEGQRIAVLGSGHSAIGTLLDLSQLAGTTVIWVVRKKDVSKAYGGGKADKLLERGALGDKLRSLVEDGRIAVEREFAVARIEKSTMDSLRILSEDQRAMEVDRLVVATGARPNLDMLREIRLGLDPALECPAALAPLIDPNFHSCGTVRPHGALQLSHPEDRFFIAGMKSYGRAPTFLLATGYEQVRSIAAWVTGDVEAANRVELELPETGVCNTRQSAEPEIKIEAVAAKNSCCNVAA